MRSHKENSSQNVSMFLTRKKYVDKVYKIRKHDVAVTAIKQNATVCIQKTTGNFSAGYVRAMFNTLKKMESKLGPPAAIYVCVGKNNEEQPPKKKAFKARHNSS